MDTNGKSGAPLTGLFPPHLLHAIWFTLSE
jgi:hypothetical protein